MAIEKKTPEIFLATYKEHALFDVRSPAEYEIGHIPGAISFPLFSDEERARVGTVYKHNGKDAAFELGLKLVGPKLSDFVKTAKMYAPDRRIKMYCWRGGQRSGSLAWLLNSAGFEVELLIGGYKNYRQYVRESFEKMSLSLLVLGGRTGTGKTNILHELEKMGEQVIDLEGLAHHKGSAFGDIGEPPQPSVEHFENLLFDHLSMFDPSRIIWVENESHNIGKVFIPQGFWQKMKSAPLVHIEIPHTERVKNLVKNYARHDPQLLIRGFQKIDTKLGGLAFKNAVAAIEEGDFTVAAKIALFYYDKTYQHSLMNSVAPSIQYLKFDFATPEKIAAELLALQKN